MPAITLHLPIVGSSFSNPFILFPCNFKHVISTSFKPTKLRKLNLSKDFFGPPQTSITRDIDSVTDVTTTSSSLTITVQNDNALDSTLFIIQARNRIGMLQVITRVFKILDLIVERATVEFEGDSFIKKFYVKNTKGKKIENVGDLENITKALMEVIEPGEGSGTSKMGLGGRGVVVTKPGLGFEALGDGKGKAEKMFRLMDEFLKNDPASL